MPKMVKQSDLNCGWYCLVSVLACWFEVIYDKAPVSIPLPCKKLLAFDPLKDLDSAYSDAIEYSYKPDSADAWEKFLSKNGPVIVSGQIGGLDFDYWPDFEFLRYTKAGHFILVVGASANLGLIYYKDPLVGDKIKTYLFTEFDSKINKWVFWTTKNGAIKILNSIGAK